MLVTVCSGAVADFLPKYQCGSTKPRVGTISFLLPQVTVIHHSFCTLTVPFQMGFLKVRAPSPAVPVPSPPWGTSSELIQLRQCSFEPKKAGEANGASRRLEGRSQTSLQSAALQWPRLINLPVITRLHSITITVPGPLQAWEVCPV